MPDSQNNNAHLDTGELRRYYRLDSVHFVSFRNVTPTENGIQEGLATTENISTGGMLLVSDIPFPLSTIITLEMAIKDEILFAKGIVVRCVESKDEEGKFDLGIRFTEIDDDSKNIIAKIIARSMLAKTQED